jgi:hypothetical protein
LRYCNHLFFKVNVCPFDSKSFDSNPHSRIKQHNQNQSQSGVAAHQDSLFLSAGHCTGRFSILGFVEWLHSRQWAVEKHSTFYGEIESCARQHVRPFQRGQNKTGSPSGGRKQGLGVGWKKSLVYKHLKSAVRHRLVKYEDCTRERNVKRLLAIDQGVGRFLPSPRSVLKRHTELGDKVKYVDPLSGEWKAVRR